MPTEISSKRPPFLEALFVAIVNFVVGGIPSILFHVWIAFNLRIPGYLEEPVVTLSPNHPWYYVHLWNAGLVLEFGVVHSITAQPWFKKILSKFLRVQYIRGFYMVVTGIQLSVMMLYWQRLDTTVWKLNPYPEFDTAVALALFSVCMIPGHIALSQHGLFEFVGLTHPFKSERQLHEEENKPVVLQTTGVYGLVRHPIYLSTLSATLVAHHMTIDRLVLWFLLAAYLMIGVHYEEKRLVKKFGSSYRLYKRHTSAIFPVKFVVGLIFGAPQDKLLSDSKKN
eukprot:ANDGO_02892.mRNA.1 hypothetical protein